MMWVVSKPGTANGYGKTLKEAHTKWSERSISTSRLRREIEISNSDLCMLRIKEASIRNELAYMQERDGNLDAAIKKLETKIAGLQQSDDFYAEQCLKLNAKIADERTSRQQIIADEVKLRVDERKTEIVNYIDALKRKMQDADWEQKKAVSAMKELEDAYDLLCCGLAIGTLNMDIVLAELRSKAKMLWGVDVDRVKRRLEDGKDKYFKWIYE